jgi:hypothetical protein
LTRYYCVNCDPALDLAEIKGQEMVKRTIRAPDDFDPEIDRQVAIIVIRLRRSGVDIVL